VANYYYYLIQLMYNKGKSCLSRFLIKKLIIVYIARFIVILFKYISDCLRYYLTTRSIILFSNYFQYLNYIYIFLEKNIHSSTNKYK